VRRLLAVILLALFCTGWVPVSPGTEGSLDRASGEATDVLSISGVVRYGHPTNAPYGQPIGGGTMRLHYGSFVAEKAIGADGEWAFSQNIHYDAVILELIPPEGWEAVYPGWRWPSLAPTQINANGTLTVFMRDSYSTYPTFENLTAYIQPIGGATPAPTATSTPTLAAPTVTPWYTYAPTPTPSRLVMGYYVVSNDGRPIEGVEFTIQHEGDVWAVGWTHADGWYQVAVAHVPGWWTICPSFPSGVSCDKIVRPAWLIWPRPGEEPSDPSCIRFKMPATIPQVSIEWKVIDERATPTMAATATATAKPTVDPSRTPSQTATRTPTATITPTVTATMTMTVLPTATLSPTSTLTNTAVPSPSRSATPTPEATLTWRQHIAIAQQLLAEIMPGWRIRVYLELDGIGDK